MKTQILQLEPDDDILSARDKIGWVQTGRVILVWPKRGRILSRRLDLILLLRWSEALGAQLAFVTDDPLIRFNARLLGVHVFKNIQKAQETRWRRIHRTKARKFRELMILNRTRVLDLSLFSHPNASRNPGHLPLSARLAFFSLGMLAFLSFAAAFLPSAEVTLKPSTQTQEITLTIQASTSTKQVNLAGFVPLRTVSVVVEGRDSMTPTGTSQVPESYAKGVVLFTNLTDQVISIPAGTVVSANDTKIRYATEHNRIILAGVSQTVTEPIIALVPGAAGNQPANSIHKIYSSLGVSLTVTNPQPITRGSDRANLAPTILDQKQLWNNLFVNLRTSALTEIQAGLQPNDLLLSTSPNLSRTIEETFEPIDLLPTNQLSLQLRLEFQAFIVSGEDLVTLIMSVQDANLPEGYYPLPNSLTLNNLTTPVLNDKSAKWQLYATRVLEARLIGSQASSLALGLSIDHAKQRMVSNLPLSSPPVISLNPTWWPRLPILPFRITVNTQG